MPSQPQRVYSVKSVMKLSLLKSVRDWLIINCGRRWHATNYKNQPLNWRSICKTLLANDVRGNYDFTVHFHFKNRDDMILFLLSWPGELLINSANDSIITLITNK